MRVCHLCLNGPYNEGWNYQENILPKYHVKNGYEVYQIVTPYMWQGTEQVISHDKQYENEFGVKVIRCKVKRGLIGGTRFDRYPELRDLLEKITPEILFIHDVQCLDILTVVKYLEEHDNCIVYVDNHSDFSNSARNWISRNILHKILWRRMAQIIEPYVTKFYGVLPARVDFLVEMYNLPEEKCELLVMGADDDFVQEAQGVDKQKAVRQKYGITADDFLIMTGGKIDLFKKQTILLMRAVHTLSEKKVKLVVFGSVAPELQEQIEELADGEIVKYIGWVNARESYYLFAAADLVIFPGRHSVFWEQVVGQGIPMVVKYWAGTTHVNCNDNVEFLYKEEEEELLGIIEKYLNKEYYMKAKKNAVNASKKFRYSSIAKKSIEI